MVNRPSQQLALAGALAAGLLAACPARAEEVLRITGTGSALGTMARLGAAFERASPGARLRLLPSLGSAGAIKAVAGGAIELGLSGRAPSAEERAHGLLALELARTPFLLAAGPRTGELPLDPEALARIYRGEVTAWPGGERLRLVLRPSTDTDTLFLRSLSPGMAAAVDAALARPGMLMAATNQDCDDLLARTPGSLGPSTLAQLITEPKGLRPLPWGGVEPSLANLAAGTYPLAKPTFLVLRPGPTPAIRRFLAFLASPEARRILEASGHLPLTLPRVD